MQLHLKQPSVMIVIIVFALAQFSFDASAKIVRMERISTASYGNFKSGEFLYDGTFAFLENSLRPQSRSLTWTRRLATPEAWSNMQREPH